MTDAAACLTPPVAEPMIPEKFDEIMGWNEYLSLGHWAMWVWEKIGGDSITEVWEGFAGNWQEVSKAGDALEKLGDFCKAASSDLSAKTSMLDGAWDGVAGTDAVSYFKNVGELLDEQEAYFGIIAKQFQECATGIKEFAQSIGAAVEILFDMVIAAGITAAATAASSWTGIGDVIGGAALAGEIIEAADKVMEILDIYSKASAALEGFVGGVMAAMTPLHGFDTVQLPDPYAGVGS